MFNNIDWYIIEDDSTAVDAGTVTLLAKEPIFHRSFNNNDTDGNNYKDSNIEKDLNSMTTSYGSFAGVANAIVDTDLDDVGVKGAKLYLLSTDEANNLSEDVLKTSTTFGDNYNRQWWLRSSGAYGDYAAFVDGILGVVTGSGDYVVQPLNVRPALKLNLAAVTFNSATNTFTPGAYINYFPNGSDNDTTLADKVVTFNGKQWYIIKDESTAVNAGTVTLLAADTSFGLLEFRNISDVQEDNFHNYNNSNLLHCKPRPYNYLNC